MFHSNTELLIGYWRSLRGEDAVPARALVDPAGFVAVASRIFVASRDVGDEFVFRLAGESLIDLHGRPHHRMEADLSFYPPFHAPETGFLTLRKAA